MGKLLKIRGENKALREQVERLNQLYFDGKLKIHMVGYFKEISYNTIGQASFLDGRFRCIGVNPVFMKLNYDITDTLVHEMVHIWQYQFDLSDIREAEGHGRTFMTKGAEIMRKNPALHVQRYATEMETKMLNYLKALKAKHYMQEWA